MSNHRAYPKSVEPGIPKLKKLKKDYVRVTFGDILYEEKRPVKLKDNEFYRLITIKRSRGGMEERAILQGKNISVQSQFRILEDDFVISKRQIVHGACALTTKEFKESIVSNEYSILKTKPNLNIQYLKYLSYTTYFQQTCFHSSVGVHIEKMIFKLQDWFKFEIDIPSLREQEKIASFLGGVDERLEQLGKKQKLLEEYKKGVMQKIFSQELRFKADDGSDYPEWIEKKLGEVFNSIKGQGLSKSDIIHDGINKCILYGELYTTYQEVIKEVKNKTNSTSGIKSLKGDLLVPCSTTTTGIDLADVTALNEENVLIGGDITILRFKKNGDSNFFAYYLTHYKRYDLAKYGQGSTIVHMYFSHFKNMQINYPSSLEEQTKIASFLSSLDEKIALIKEELNGTQQFKKALLQQMFV